MPSELKVNKLSPYTGTTLTLGDSGDTISLPSGVSLDTLTITGDLTVDTDTFKVDSTNNLVGVGGTSTVGGGATNGQILFSIPSSNRALTIKTVADGAEFDIGTTNTNLGKDLIFSSGGSEAMRINSSGNVGIGTTSPSQKVHIKNTGTGSVRLRIENDEGFGEFSTDGDAVQLRNQTGIILNSVSAGDTQIRDGSASVKMTVTSSGTQFNDAIFLGGTGSANELDDYEYGTWTPVYSSAGGLPSSVTYDRQNGYYYKIGGVVHIWWTLRTDAINTTGMSGDFYVSGLPFTIGATVNDAVLAGGDAIVDNFLNDTVLTKTGALDNTTNIAFFVEGSHAGTDATTVLKNAANANSMYGHMTYFVDF